MRRLLLIAMALVGVSTVAQATPTYYSFSGTVSSLHPPGIDGLPPLYAPVQYTFLVDLSLPGTETFQGIVYPKCCDHPGDYHYFYADLVSGSPLVPATWTHLYDPFAFNYGYDGTTTGTNAPTGFGYLFGTAGSVYISYVYVQRPSPVETWTVGDAFYGQIGAENQGIGFAYFLTDGLTLDSISLSPRPPFPSRGAFCCWARVCWASTVSRGGRDGRKGQPGPRLRTGAQPRGLAQGTYFTPISRSSTRPSFLCLPCFVSGTPIRRDSRASACEMPRARRHENDRPGKSFIGAPPGARIASGGAARRRRRARALPQLLAKPPREGLAHERREDVALVYVGP